jgi:regulator of ribonuclease activity A
VLVVDGGGSRQCALLGDLLAAKAVENGWAGVVVHGCVRDTAVLAGLDLGVLALEAYPRRSKKRGEGHRDVTVRFAGVSFHPGAWVYADEDGLLVAAHELPAAPAG